MRSLANPFLEVVWITKPLTILFDSKTKLQIREIVKFCNTIFDWDFLNIIALNAVSPLFSWASSNVVKSACCLMKINVPHIPLSVRSLYKL